MTNDYLKLMMFKSIYDIILLILLLLMYWIYISAQLRELKKVTLGKIMCDNLGITEVPTNVFLYEGNRWVNIRWYRCLYFPLLNKFYFIICIVIVYMNMSVNFIYFFLSISETEWKTVIGKKAWIWMLGELKIIIVSENFL